jgi:hypothetical protein
MLGGNLFFLRTGIWGAVVRRRAERGKGHAIRGRVASCSAAAVP